MSIPKSYGMPRTENEKINIFDLRYFSTKSVNFDCEEISTYWFQELDKTDWRDRALSRCQQRERPIRNRKVLKPIYFQWPGKNQIEFYRREHLRLKGAHVKSAYSLKIWDFGNFQNSPEYCQVWYPRGGYWLSSIASTRGTTVDCRNGQLWRAVPRLFHIFSKPAKTNRILTNLVQKPNYNKKKKKNPREKPWKTKTPKHFH